MATTPAIDSGLTEVFHLNDQIAQVAATRIPLQFDSSTPITQAQLEQLNSSVALKASRGTTLQDALADQSDAYHLTLRSFRDSHGSLSSLELLYQFAFQHQLDLRTWRYAFGHFLALYLLAGVTLFLWLPPYTKIIQKIYETSKVSAGPAFHWLMFLNSNYYTIFAIYLLLLSLIFVAPFIAARLTPQLRKRISDTEYSRMVLALAKMLPNGIHPVNRTYPSEQSTSPSGSEIDLIQWASLYAEPKPNRPLSASFKAVEQLMKRRLVSIELSHRRRYPIFGRIIPGAMVVLLMGTLLFWPMVELLITICLP